MGNTRHCAFRSARRHHPPASSACRPDQELLITRNATVALGVRGCRPRRLGVEKCASRERGEKPGLHDSPPFGTRNRSEAQTASHLSDAVARAQAPTSTGTSTTSPSGPDAELPMQYLFSQACPVSICSLARIHWADGLGWNRLHRRLRLLGSARRGGDRRGSHEEGNRSVRPHPAHHSRGLTPFLRGVKLRGPRWV
jgi:hypothetical protein